MEDGGLEIIECQKMDGATHGKRTCIARMKRLITFDNRVGRSGKNAWNYSGAEWAESPFEICRDCELGRELMEKAGLEPPEIKSGK